MTSPRNLKTIAGCPTRILVSITAPEDTDTELTGYVNSAGTPLAAAVQGSAQEGEVLFPPLPAGEHLYEIRCAGKPIAWGHLLARQTAYPLQPTDVVDWELAADLTATDAAQISLELLPGARGLTGESAYDAALQGGYQGTEAEFAAMLAALPQDAANAAESAADAAAASAAAAASQAAAAASATAAGNSATAAAGSATAASTKATDAANSATTAATKATDAATSATAAAGSATEAGISAASAGASAQDAADDAADASTAAATATAQATEATTQAGNAAASATTASQQATAAANSASAAAGSATTAGTKATEAAGSASTAAAKATDAANSANAAAQSAADAAESAEQLGDATLQGRNNTFTQTNTFNGEVALNGPVTLGSTYGTAAYTADSSELGFFFEMVVRLANASNLNLATWKSILPAIHGNLPNDLAFPAALNVKDIGTPHALFSIETTRIPDLWTFDTLTIGGTTWEAVGTRFGMFSGCSSLTSLPEGMTLSALTNGSSMFSGCSSLTSLPEGMTLPVLTNGYYMFAGCSSLASLPDGMTLPALVDGSSMFSGCPFKSSLTSLPDGMTLPALTSGVGLFSGFSSLTSLPDGMTLSALTNGSYMFNGCSSLHTLPESFDLSRLKAGFLMFEGCTLDKSSILRVLNALQSPAPTGSWDAGVMHIGKRTLWADDPDVAEALGITLEEGGVIPTGTITAPNGWKVTIES